MASDSRQPPYDLGLAELARYLYDLDEAALARAVDAFREATALAPSDPACWTALGFVLDAAGSADEALVALRSAMDLGPEDGDVEIFALNLLSELGAEAEALAGIEAAAARYGVDLGALRGDLAAAGMPADSGALLTNGFIRPRNFVRSRLEDEIERAERRRDPTRWSRLRDAELRECSDMQAEVGRSIDPERVPTAIRALTPWASRLGVGDDLCRGWLMGQLTAAERSELLLAVAELGSAAQRWLDEFEPGAMSDEAAAFMYLLLGAEEWDMDGAGRHRPT